MKTVVCVARLRLCAQDACHVKKAPNRKKASASATTHALLQSAARGVWCPSQHRLGKDLENATTRDE